MPQPRGVSVSQPPPPPPRRRVWFKTPGGLVDSVIGRFQTVADVCDAVHERLGIRSAKRTAVTLFADAATTTTAAAATTAASASSSSADACGKTAVAEGRRLEREVGIDYSIPQSCFVPPRRPGAQQLRVEFDAPAPLSSLLRRPTQPPRAAETEGLAATQPHQLEAGAGASGGDGATAAAEEADPTVAALKAARSATMAAAIRACRTGGSSLSGDSGLIEEYAPHIVAALDRALRHAQMAKEPVATAAEKGSDAAMDDPPTRPPRRHLTLLRSEAPIPTSRLAEALPPTDADASAGSAIVTTCQIPLPRRPKHDVRRVGGRGRTSATAGVDHRNSREEYVAARIRDVEFGAAGQQRRVACLFAFLAAAGGSGGVWRLVPLLGPSSQPQQQQLGLASSALVWFALMRAPAARRPDLHCGVGGLPPSPRCALPEPSGAPASQPVDLGATHATKAREPRPPPAIQRARSRHAQALLHGAVQCEADRRCSLAEDEHGARCRLALRLVHDMPANADDDDGADRHPRDHAVGRWRRHVAEAASAFGGAALVSAGSAAWQGRVFHAPRQAAVAVASRTVLQREEAEGAVSSEPLYSIAPPAQPEVAMGADDTPKSPTTLVRGEGPPADVEDPDSAHTPPPPPPGVRPSVQLETTATQCDMDVSSAAAQNDVVADDAGNVAVAAPDAADVAGPAPCEPVPPKPEPPTQAAEVTSGSAMEEEQFAADVVLVPEAGTTVLVEPVSTAAKSPEKDATTPAESSAETTLAESGREATAIASPVPSAEPLQAAVAAVELATAEAPGASPGGAASPFEVVEETVRDPAAGPVAPANPSGPATAVDAVAAATAEATPAATAVAVPESPPAADPSSFAADADGTVAPCVAAANAVQAPGHDEQQKEQCPAVEEADMAMLVVADVDDEVAASCPVDAAAVVACEQQATPGEAAATSDSATAEADAAPPDAGATVETLPNETAPPATPSAPESPDVSADAAAPTDNPAAADLVGPDEADVPVEADSTPAAAAAAAAAPLQHDDARSPNAAAAAETPAAADSPSSTSPPAAPSAPAAEDVEGHGDEEEEEEAAARTIQTVARQRAAAHDARQRRRQSEGGAALPSPPAAARRHDDTDADAIGDRAAQTIQCVARQRAAAADARQRRLRVAPEL